jgi:putative transposase
MSTYTQLLIQIVFGAKNCSKFLNDANQDMLFNYIAGVCRNKRIIPYAIGGHVDHIHMVLDFHPSISISDFVKDVKLSTNALVKKNRELFNHFDAWQIGYSAFSYEAGAKANLMNYVHRQEEHHCKKSFIEELVELYDEFGIDYEEKYILV